MNQLFLMREGVRRVEVMMPLVKDLTDPELNALAAHFSALPARASGEPLDPALVERGAELAARGAAAHAICRVRPASNRCRDWRNSASIT